MKYFIENNLHIKPEPIIIFETNDVDKLVHFVREIAVENEDEELSIICFEEAKEYIDTYCDNLVFNTESIFWERLGNVCVDENDDIDDNFSIFDKGTPKDEIWHWFEEYFDTQIGGNYL